VNALLQSVPEAEPAHRPMSMSDLDAVLAVECVAYSFPWTRGNFIDSLAAGYRCELRTAEDGRVVAYTVAMPVVDEMHLLNITVAPDLQGQGHATAMMQRLIDHGRQHGMRSLWLEVRPSNQPARRLYTRCGLREVGLRRAYYPAGGGQREDAIVMSRTIDLGPEPFDELD
jgi:[ribosomal protein S18]-alanine N-acetyltransferase